MRRIRWHLRFENYKRALRKLDEAVAGLRSGTQSRLESEGTIQRFEYTWELAWKSMRDWLRASGHGHEVPSAKNVIRMAFSVSLIANGDDWIEAMKDRNELSHEYRESAFDRVLAAIDSTYHRIFLALEARLQAEYDAGN